MESKEKTIETGKKKDFLRQPTLVIDKITNLNKEVKFGKTQKDAIVQALRRVGVFYMAGKHQEYGQIASTRFAESNKGWNRCAAGILEYPPKPILHVMGKYFETED